MFSDNYGIIFRLHKYTDSVTATRHAVHTMAHNSQSITVWSRQMDTRNSSDQLIDMKCREQNFLLYSVPLIWLRQFTVRCLADICWTRAKQSIELAVCIKTVVVELWCRVVQSVRTFRKDVLLLSWGLIGSFVQIIVKLSDILTSFMCIERPPMKI